MDAKRLEELARRTQYCVDDKDIAIETYLSVDDLRDLVRCAAAGAKVERCTSAEMYSGTWQKPPWTFIPQRSKPGGVFIGDTAIEAVEAAKEVSDAK